MTQNSAQAEKLRSVVSRMTPGPWKSRKSDFDVAEVYPDDRTIKRPFIPTQICGLDDRLGSRKGVEFAKADAAGIAMLRNEAMPLIDALLARVAELEKDVARYRWLRDPQTDIGLVIDK